MDLEVLERAPEAGDAEAVDGLVAGFVARAERFAQRAVSVRAAGDGLASASAGEWASALVERSTRLASGLDDAAGGCREVAQVLAGYGSALRALRRRVLTARHEVWSARERAVVARERYWAAASAGGAPVVPASWTDAPALPAVPEAADELRAWRAAVRDAAEGLRAFVACCDEREDLDRQVAAQLAGLDVMAAYAPGTTLDAIVDVPLVQALAATSAGTVTAEQRRLLSGWFDDAVTAVADDLGDDAALSSLTDFLRAWQGDEDTMSAAFAVVGGSRIVRLLTDLGQERVAGADGRNARLVAAADAVRAGLASASRTWNAGAAQRFAAAMVDVARSRRGTLSVIGYLFCDPTGARMSEQLTVAVADQLDLVEQETGLAWREEYGSIGQGLTTPGAMTDGVPVHDPAAHVLATLALYPQAARDWLTAGHGEWSVPGATPETVRIAHWFGARDWSQGASDGFEVIGSLWAVVQASGPHAPEAAQVAGINTLAFKGLSQNPFFVPGQVSAAGAQGVATAVSAQLPGLIEVGIVRSAPDKDEIRVMWESVQVPYLESEIVTARIDTSWVGPVLRAATSDPAARQTVADAVLAYQAQALEAAYHPDGASPGAVLDRLAVAWGAVDGASVSAAEVERYERDARTRSHLDAARGVIDGGVALSPVRPMASIGVDQLLNQVQALAESAMTDGPLPEWATTSTFPAGVDSLDDAFEHAVTSYREAGRWDREGVRAGDTGSTDAALVADEYVERYSLMVDAMRARGMDDVKESM